MNVAMILTSMTNNLEVNGEINKILDSCGKPKDNPDIQDNTNTPSILNDIQPRATQVWNCDQIRLYPMESGTRLSVLKSPSQ